jgi:hypothetical protein
MLSPIVDVRFMIGGPSHIVRIVPSQYSAFKYTALSSSWAGVINLVPPTRIVGKPLVIVTLYTAGQPISGVAFGRSGSGRFPVEMSH